MNLPNIDFKNIRPVNGNCNAGFEELCCQLAKLDNAHDVKEFIRKGQGADAGIECYIRLNDGKEIGWQGQVHLSMDR